MCIIKININSCKKWKNEKKISLVKNEKKNLIS